MKIEQLSQTQLIAEKDRLGRAIPRVLARAQSLLPENIGSGQAPLRYYYNHEGLPSLERLQRIEHVGDLRHRLKTIAIPALENRYNAVSVRQLQLAEQSFARMEQSGKYRPEELQIAQEAIEQLKVELEKPSPALAHPIETAPQPQALVAGGELPHRTIRILEDGTILVNGEVKKGRLSDLTERPLLEALAREFSVTGNRRLSSAELAQRAYGQSPQDSRLSVRINGLRMKLNRGEDMPYLISSGPQGTHAWHGFPEDVDVISDRLDLELREQQEKARESQERARRLMVLKQSLFEKHGSKQEQLFAFLFRNLGQYVSVAELAQESGLQSHESLKRTIFEIRNKLDHYVGTYQYEIDTKRSKAGTSYVLIERERIRPSVPLGEDLDALRGGNADTEHTPPPSAPSVTPVESPLSISTARSEVRSRANEPKNRESKFYHK